MKTECESLKCFTKFVRLLVRGGAVSAGGGGDVLLVSVQLQI